MCFDKMSFNYGISVVIPTKNRHDKIILAVESAAKIRNVSQILVIDDGSTPEITLDSFSGLSADDKLIILKNAYVAGAQGARLTGAMSSCNEIVLFLDSDDLLLESGVTHLYQAIQADPGLAMVYSDVIGQRRKSTFLRVNGNGFRDVLRNLSLCPFSGLMVRKTLIHWESLDLRLPAWQDDDFCLVACQNGRVQYIDTPAASMMVSSDSISKSRFGQVIGLALLIDRWKIEIVNEFGAGRLFLWRLRLLSSLLDAISVEIKSLRKKSVVARIFSTIGYFIFWLLAKMIFITIRCFFDRIYA